LASCWVDAGVGGDDGGASSGDDGGMAGMAGMGGCAFGATMFGQHGDDDDCKYVVSWTSDPICVGLEGVEFTVSVWSLVDGTPITGIPNGLVAEAFIPTNPDASCDVGTHGSPGSASSPYLTEVAAGTGVYKGPVVFDIPGQWTVRFHIHEECYDVLPTSPHGHAAFRVTVP
jgi:hypothetical protein